MSLPHIQVERRIEALNSLIVYRVRTIKRFLIPMNLFWNPLMSCDMGRHAGVIIVFALLPRIGSATFSSQRSVPLRSCYGRLVFGNP